MIKGKNRIQRFSAVRDFFSHYGTLNSKIWLSNCFPSFIHNFIGWVGSFQPKYLKEMYLAKRYISFKQCWLCMHVFPLTLCQLICAATVFACV